MRLLDTLEATRPAVNWGAMLGEPLAEHLITLEQARQRVATMARRQEEARSDSAWWGYASEKACWGCLGDLLEAAALCGPDNLPEVARPDIRGRMLMDAIAEVGEFGRLVLQTAQAQSGLASVEKG